jgi:hypothetical protein
MGFGNWNAKSHYTSGSPKTEARALAECKSDSVGIQEVRWDRGGTEPVDDSTLSYDNWNENHHLGAGFLFYIQESYQ